MAYFFLFSTGSSIKTREFIIVIINFHFLPLSMKIQILSALDKSSNENKKKLFLYSFSKSSKNLNFFSSTNHQQFTRKFNNLRCLFSRIGWTKWLYARCAVSSHINQFRVRMFINIIFCVKKHRSIWIISWIARTHTHEKELRLDK